MRPLANQLLAIPDLPAYIKYPIERAMSGESQAGLALLALMIPILMSGLQQGIGGPIGRIVEAVTDQVLRSRLLDPASLITLWYRGIITEGRLNGLLAKNGLNQEAMTALKQLGRPLLDDTALTNLLWRKDMSVSEVAEVLGKKGYNSEQIGHWINLRNVIPSPGELIGIAVREGFNDGVAARFGYDEDYPSDAAELAEKGGLSQKFFKAQWRAHWRLPGLVQVREMFNRNIITENDLMSYLKAADLPVFWRTAITQWIKSVVTRVDARRMYAMGIWTKERVFKHYGELGYSDDDAQDMTLWTQLNYLEGERELTKTDILGMYQDGILNVEETSIYLTALDYKPESISLLIAHRDLKREEEYERQIISNVRALYVGGMYDRTTVFAKLGVIGTPDAVIQQSLAVWDLEKERRVKLPSITQLRDMAQEGVITIPEFMDELRIKKYPEKYIRWYVSLWLSEE
jgi:hypothetical protein